MTPQSAVQERKLEASGKQDDTFESSGKASFSKIPPELLRRAMGAWIFV
jgi:hypothetical protein